MLKRPVELSWHTHQTIHWPLMPCMEPSAFIVCLKLLICHLPVCRSRFRWTCMDMQYLDMDHPQLFLLKKGFNSGSCMWGIFYGPLHLMIGLFNANPNPKSWSCTCIVFLISLKSFSPVTISPLFKSLTQVTCIRLCNYSCGWGSSLILSFTIQWDLPSVLMTTQIGSVKSIWIRLSCFNWTIQPGTVSTCGYDDLSLQYNTRNA